MVLSSMQLQKVSVTLIPLACATFAFVCFFFDMRSAECVCSYYGPHVCS